MKKSFNENFSNSLTLYEKHVTRSKKVVLFPENDRVKIVLSLTRPHGRNCIRTQYFLLKQTNKQTNKKKTSSKKGKETKKTKLVVNFEFYSKMFTLVIEFKIHNGGRSVSRIQETRVNLFWLKHFVLDTSFLCSMEQQACS